MWKIALKMIFPIFPSYTLYIYIIRLTNDLPLIMGVFSELLSAEKWLIKSINQTIKDLSLWRSVCKKLSRQVRYFLFLLFLFDKHEQPRLFFWAVVNTPILPTFSKKDRLRLNHKYGKELRLLFFCQIVWPLFRGGMGLVVISVH